MKVVIEIAKNSKNEKVKSLAIQVLKNTSKISDYERMLAQNNALELTLNLVSKSGK
jgi:predicted outer membrane protein